MGFWHTGYIEFHEPVGLDRGYDQSPTIYRCQHCNATFTSAESFRVHRFEEHPYHRPILFLSGVEAGTTPIRITRSIEACNVRVSRCDQAWINNTAVAPRALGRTLARITNDTVTVRLANEGVAAEFMIRFEIASEADLDGVDRCFFEVARLGKLDRRSVEDFIATTRAFPTAIGYCDGICEYFYGVLAKERSLESSLSYESYREKFTRAADALKDFERPLAKTIGALIAFHFNHFRENFNLAETSRVGIASRRFERWMKGDPYSAIQIGAHRDTLEKLLTDLETERLIAWSVAAPESIQRHLQDMESMVRQDIPEFDRTKLWILLAESHTYCNHIVDARRYARELRNNPTFGAWAERLIAQLSEME